MLSQKEILAVAIKALSLWFFCWLFIQVVGIVPLLSAVGAWQGNQVPIWFFLILCLSFLSAGFLISRILFYVSSSVLNSLSSDQDIFITDEGQRYIFQLFGLFFVVSSLTWFPSSLSFLFVPVNNEVQFYYFLKPLGYLMELVIGAWLILHPSWWYKLFKKLRRKA